MREREITSVVCSLSIMYVRAGPLAQLQCTSQINHESYSISGLYYVHKHLVPSHGIRLFLGAGPIGVKG